MNDEGANSGSTNDVRSMGLGIPENSSRDIGAGETVMPNVSPPQLEREGIMDEVRIIIEQQRVWFEAKISLLEAKISSNFPASSMPLSTAQLAKPSKTGRCCEKYNVEINKLDSEALSFAGRRELMKVKFLNIIVHDLT